MTKRLLALFFLASFAAPVPTGFAAQMLMLEQPGCVWCARFNEEIAPAWPQTPEGQRAPLRRIDITEPWPDDLEGVSRDIMTPTFILVEDGVEVARLRGYPGDEFFWFRIGELMDGLPKDDKTD
ncbi:transcriptional regulator [Notoacmeibacter marinus]|uniref:transcriptional regulator n=1 Tax=Notoacmeibacter marinus TaxID=1876515 RepID=UPI000DF2ACBC|nr:transcriptional regulator [Notoacmeibacter marinus]